MKTILVSSLSIHWAVVFAYAAARAIGVGGTGSGASAGVAILATAHALVAVLFAWLAVCAWGRRSADADTVIDVARFSVAGAATTLAIVALLDSGSRSLESIALQLGALGVTYLVFRTELVPADERKTPDFSHAAARRLALGAAHGSMLTRLSQRGYDPKETDA